jgi:hypothetical protein
MYGARVKGKAWVVRHWQNATKIKNLWIDWAMFEKDQVIDFAPADIWIGY